MTQEQWIAAAKEELRKGPLRFNYDALRVKYILRDTGDDIGGHHSPSYHLRIEDRQGRMLQESFGYTDLAKLLQRHPLDRFMPERQFDALLLDYARLELEIEKAGRQLIEDKSSATLDNPMIE